MTVLNNPSCRLLTTSEKFTRLSAYYEEERRTVWMMLRFGVRPCFDQILLEEIMNLTWLVRGSCPDVDFWVTASQLNGLFSTGGDLHFLSECLRDGRREALRAYARACVDCIYTASTGFNNDAVTLSMVSGNASGGAFETALAHHFVLAQRDARLGFPEIAFNLFPGMGGYSLASRRAGIKLTEQLIYTGESHTAEWHEQCGLVDILFEKNTGYAATREFIDTMQPRLNGVRAMLRTRQRVTGLSRSELMDITEDWVDSAFSLQTRDIAWIEHLVRLQNRRMAVALCRTG
ncbi:crotonase/enoyl-CoA hydratase family protein [Salmonella enterica subsp. diarizonae]|nr:enoyl-CoA hydratase [Salmonella enterica subsp. arizonae]EEJ3294073.1 crotonase/enoyl-CoA hydratase family protein [Salmonella enterica subsp. diarizonae]